jgi:hypothetical protein
MGCEDLREQVDGYVHGRLSIAELAALDDHLDRCEDCTALVGERLAAGSEEPADELLRLLRLRPVTDRDAQPGIDAVLGEVRRRRGALSPEAAGPGPSTTRRRLAPGWLRPAFGFAAVGMIAVLSLIAWQQVEQSRKLEQQLGAVEAGNRALQRENSALREDLARAQGRSDPNAVARLQAENERLKQQIASRGDGAPDVGDAIRLRDGGRVIAIPTEGAVRIVSETDLPASLAEPVRSLVLRGAAPPVARVARALAALDAEAAESALRSAREGESALPLPVSPVSTAVRATRPVLRWRAVPGAEGYTVRVALPEEKESGRVVWEGTAGPEPEAAVPAGVLRRGESYFWQVETIAGGEARLSPAVGFWVLDESTLGDLLALEKRHAASPLLLTALLEAHGLYEEARAKLDRVAAANPASPHVRTMIEGLDRRAGRAATSAR